LRIQILIGSIADPGYHQRRINPMPLFSVIIPTRNRESFLREAVASVLAQSITDFELLIVNDGNTALQPFDDTRIIIIDNKQQGHVPARITGITHVKGKFIAFLDDDDIWIDDAHLGRAAHLLGTTADLTFADGIMKFPHEENPRIFARDATPTTLERDNTILISAVCYRASIHETLANFDVELPYYWDWDWYLRVARAGFRLVHDENQSVDIRVHAQNMSGESNTKPRADNLKRFADKHKIGPLTLKNHADFAVQEHGHLS
jgi:glycosyltransferase involved in cell wall biosynthesis